MSRLVLLVFISLTSVYLSCDGDVRNGFNDKRLVLHSDGDILQALSKFQSELTEMQASNMNLTKIVDALEKKVASLETKNTALQSTQDKLVQGAGAVYVRWGRNICPHTAELVYKGFTGGKRYDDTGSGNDHLCLPSDPSWANYHDGVESTRAYIYGSEIHTEDYQHIFYHNVHQQDMPCAVCRTKKSSALMIPGRSHCYTGWTLEYSGYLMAGSNNHKASLKHICMDASPEFVPNGGAYAAENLVYLVEARCGILSCPPYVNGRELSCVVCSK